MMNSISLYFVTIFLCANSSIATVFHVDGNSLKISKKNSMAADLVRENASHIGSEVAELFRLRYELVQANRLSEPEFSNRMPMSRRHEIASEYLSATRKLLKKLGFKTQFVQQAEYGDTIVRIFGNSKSEFGRFIRDYEKTNPGMSVMIMPRYPIVDYWGLGAAEDEKGIYVTLDSIISLHSDGRLYSFLKFQKIDLHELTHTWFTSRRLRGFDDTFDWHFKVKKGYRKFDYLYDSGFKGDEYAAYVDDTATYSEELKEISQKLKEGQMIASQVGKHWAIKDLISNVDQYVSSFTYNFSQATARFESLLSYSSPGVSVTEGAYHAKTPSGSITAKLSAAGLYPVAVEVEFTTEFEVTKVFLRNPRAVGKFRQMVRKPELSGSIGDFLKQQIGKRISTLKRFSEQVVHLRTITKSDLRALKGGGSASEKASACDRLARLVKRYSELRKFWSE